jgi:hypothetical protein
MIFKLYIDNNNLGPAGARVLAEVLPGMTQLTNLNLGCKLL